MRIGIDLGGTKIEGIAIDGAGVERARLRTPTPPSYDATIGALGALVSALEAQAGAAVRAVGVGMPGSISPATGLARNGNSTWLNGRPFDRDLQSALGRPVRVANDANCFALSEATDGAAAGAGIVFGVILGTGCGGGLVVDGRVRDGAAGVAGEWGHNPLPWATPAETEIAPCWCGRRGCMETWVSGPAIARDHVRAGAGAMTAREIAAAAEAGDAAAVATLARWADRLARGLAVVINLLDPDVIVFGGGVSQIGALYRDVPPLLSRYVFSDVVATKLAPNRHGDSSGVRGAAWLWRTEDLK
ncbi:MAG: ROK family protein [Hyphomonadaceae bacterium]|nr:ROK family protein [Hyphomonadaceae bacterium]